MSCRATPGLAVIENTTGAIVVPGSDAATRTAPAMESTTTVTRVVPSAAVVVRAVFCGGSATSWLISADTLPAPVITAQSTFCPATGLPSASVTFTTSGCANVARTVSTWLLPAAMMSAAAVPASAVAFTDTVGTLGRPDACASKVYAPAS